MGRPPDQWGWPERWCHTGKVNGPPDSRDPKDPPTSSHGPPEAVGGKTDYHLNVTKAPNVLLGINESIIPIRSPKLYQGAVFRRIRHPKKRSGKFTLAVPS